MESKSGKWSTPPAFVFLMMLSVVAYGGMVGVDWWYGTLRDGYTPLTIGWYLLAFVGYLGALLWVERRGGVSMRLVWGAAIVLRVLLLFTVPTLSDDVYRYIWDGYVANKGVSPYAYAIKSPELDYLEIPQRALANNTWMASPYLPAAQFVFFGLTFAFPLEPIFMQVAMVIFDLLSAFLLLKLLALAQLPRYRLLIYLWNPLVIVEVAHGAHIDAWMILLTLAAVWFTLSAREENERPIKYYLSPIFLGLATLTKILPVLLLPIFFWRWSWRQLILYGAVSIGLLIPAGSGAGWGLAGPLDGTGLFGALRIYGSKWNFNSGLFHWLEVQLGKSGAADPLLTAKMTIAVAMLFVLLAVWLVARRQPSTLATLRLMAVPYMAYLLLATTVHPWYSLILLAFLPFLPPNESESRQPRASLARWLTIMPWLYLSAALALSYLTYLDPLNFGELEWVRETEWLPTLALFLISVAAFLFYIPPKNRRP